MSDQKIFTSSGGVSVQSPQNDHSVGTAFTATGTFDTQLGATRVECHLVKGQTRTEADSYGFYPNRGVWTATFDNATPDTYDSLEVVLFDRNNFLADGKSTNVTVAATPDMVITMPTAGQMLGSTAVKLRLEFPQGHPIDQVRAELFGLSGSESRLINPDKVGGQYWEWDTSGNVGDGHYFIVTGHDARDNLLISASVGGILLS